MNRYRRRERSTAVFTNFGRGCQLTTSTLSGCYFFRLLDQLTNVFIIHQKVGPVCLLDQLETWSVVLRTEKGLRGGAFKPMDVFSFNTQLLLNIISFSHPGRLTRTDQLDNLFKFGMEFQAALEFAVLRRLSMFGYLLYQF